MNKCLVTKLSGVVSNNKLAKIGELAFPLDENITSIGYGSNADATLRIADGTFEDGSNSKFVNLSEWETVLKFSSKKDAILFVPNKKDITIFSVYTNKSYNAPFNISELKYMKSLKYTSINQNTGVYGDIASVPPTVISLGLSGTSVSGDIQSLETIPQDLMLDNTRVYGDVSTRMGNTQRITAKNVLGLHGDLSKFGTEVAVTNTLFVSSPSSFTWSERPASAVILAIESCNLGNYVDKMLQDQANCKATTASNLSSWHKLIDVKGTRTSASDAAVATLQQKGYTVSVTPA